MKPSKRSCLLTVSPWGLAFSVNSEGHKHSVCDELTFTRQLLGCSWQPNLHRGEWLLAEGVLCVKAIHSARRWRRQWHPTLVLLPGKSHEWRSMVGCSPWRREELDTAERLHFHFSLSCIGEGNGNPLQCSCLENLRDGGAWWAAVYGVAQSRTWLKHLSSSSVLNGWTFICWKFLALQE